MSSAESLALDTSGTWTSEIPCNPLIAKQLESWRRGGAEYLSLFETLYFLIFLEAKYAENGRNAANWNVSGTRDFQPAVQICEEFTSPLSTSYPRVTFACRPNFPEGRLNRTNVEFGKHWSLSALA